MTDSFQNRILYHLSVQNPLTWTQLMEILTLDIGFAPNPNTLSFHLKKLRNDKKVRFQQIGDLIYYHLISQS